MCAVLKPPAAPLFCCWASFRETWRNKARILTNSEASQCQKNSTEKISFKEWRDELTKIASFENIIIYRINNNLDSILKIWTPYLEMIGMWWSQWCLYTPSLYQYTIRIVRGTNMSCNIVWWWCKLSRMRTLLLIISIFTYFFLFPFFPLLLFFMFIIVGFVFLIVLFFLKSYFSFVCIGTLAVHLLWMFS